MFICITHFVTYYTYLYTGKILVFCMFFEIFFFYLHYPDSGILLYFMDLSLKTVSMFSYMYLKDNSCRFSFSPSLLFSLYLTTLTTVMFLLVSSFCFCKLLKKHMWTVVFFHVLLKWKSFQSRFCLPSPSHLLTSLW